MPPIGTRPPWGNTDAMPPIHYLPGRSRGEYTSYQQAQDHAWILGAYGLTVTVSTVRRDDDPFAAHTAYIVEVTRG